MTRTTARRIDQVSYAEVRTALVNELPTAEWAAVFGGTTVRTYDLLS